MLCPLAVATPWFAGSHALVSFPMGKKTKKGRPQSNNNQTAVEAMEAMEANEDDDEVYEIEPAARDFMKNALAEEVRYLHHLPGSRVVKNAPPVSPCSRT